MKRMNVEYWFFLDIFLRASIKVWILYEPTECDNLIKYKNINSTSKHKVKRNILPMHGNCYLLPYVTSFFVLSTILKDTKNRHDVLMGFLIYNHILLHRIMFAFRSETAKLRVEAESCSTPQRVVPCRSILPRDADDCNALSTKPQTVMLFYWAVPPSAITTTSYYYTNNEFRYHKQENYFFQLCFKSNY